MKMFKSAGGLLVTDKIKFKIMASRHEPHHLFTEKLTKEGGSDGRSDMLIN
jgi:hypothetical protein